MERKELVAKLEEISARYEDVLSVREEIENYEPYDKYERKVEVPDFPGEDADWEEYIDHEDDDAVEQMGKLYMDHHAPKCPAKPEIKEFVEPNDSAMQNNKSKMGCLSYGAAGGCIFFLLGALLNLNDEYGSLGVMLVIAAVLGAAFVVLKKKVAQEDEKIKEFKAQALEAYNAQKEERLADHQKKLDAYHKEMEVVEQAKGQFLEEYIAWRTVYLEHVEEENAIAEKLEADRLAQVLKITDEKLQPANEKLAAVNDTVPEDYLPVVDVLTELIRTNRADDIKEAINLYEELVYRERQLQLQREQEEQRRREEEQRREDEERRYREEMRFREDQERHRRDEEDRRHREEERAAKKREEQEREDARRAEREARSRCHWCKNYHSCGIRHNPPQNCTAFNPSNTHTI